MEVSKYDLDQQSAECSSPSRHSKGNSRTYDVNEGDGGHARIKRVKLPNIYTLTERHNIYSNNITLGVVARSTLDRRLFDAKIALPRIA